MGKRYMVFLCLLLAAGIAVLFYPTVSSAINRRSGSYAISNWQQQIGQMDSDDRREQLHLAQEYNRALLRGEPADDYDQLLNMGSGMMGYIRIPRIQVDLPIYHGVEEDVLARGVGHLPESALPIGGEGSHSVLTGHTGLPSAKLFTDLTQLQEGDLFYIHVLEQVLCYRVDQIKVVLPSQAEDLAPRPGADHCTLVTCTPYGINSHRLLVRGERVAEEVEISLPAAEEPGERNRWWLLMIAPGLLAGLWLLDGLRKPAYNGKYLAASHRESNAG